MELMERRKKAEADFKARGYPTTKEELWRFTDVSRMAEGYADPAAAVCSAADWTPTDIVFECLGGICLVFENGRLSMEKSCVPGLPEGVRISSIMAHADDPRIGLLADAQSAFVSANTAYFKEGACVEIAGGVELDTPIHLIYLADAAGCAFQYRNLISVGADAKAAIVEEYIGGGTETPDQPYWTNAVTEVFAGDGAVVDHYKIQRENSAAYHFQTLEVQLGQKSCFSNHAVTLGGALGRNDIRGKLTGKGGEAICNGLYLLKGEQHFDTHMFMDHAVPECNSHELYKGILDERARAVFCGRILVQQDAQQTDAIQSNGNLLLSRQAKVHTLPQLEIYADDVKCTHGATIGQLDDDSLFYLQTRGIDPQQGHAILTLAFANEVLDEVGSNPVKAYLETLVKVWLKEVSA